MKVAVFSTKAYDKTFLDKFNKGKHELIYYEAALNADTTNLTIGFDAVCIFVNDKADRPTMEALAANGIKLVALRCAGFNNVDLAAAEQNKIKVARVPAYSPQAVAEHAVALILTLNRKTHKAYNRIRESNFSVVKLMGFNLYQKTVGVIGTGKIGSVFCDIMKGFGCQVIAYDLYPSDSLKAKGVEYTLLDELIAQSDIISLHCPLTPDTHHLVNEQAINTMKPGVMIINTSRGGVIDTSAVIEGLRIGRIGYLGIDAYEQEENLFFRDLSESNIHDEMLLRLMSFHNVLITAHQGFFTQEAMDGIASTTMKNLKDYEKGVLENEVKVEKVVV